jgi:hypothetical protein
MKNIDFKLDELDELDNHFTQKLNERLDEIREQFNYSDNSPTKVYINNSHRESDSPLTMSIHSEYDENTLCTMEDCTSELNVVDVLNIYCRSQKYMYEQANIITQYQHNTIYGITITITSGVCIFISFMETKWKNVIIISLNAIVCILIVMAKYLKLETSAELYLYISKQFDFIYNMSNAIQYRISKSKSVAERNTIIPEKIKEVEDRITETRDIPNITIPQIIQKLYPISANINMFTFIKKIDTKKLDIEEELQKINIELRYIAKKYNNNMGSRESQRFHFLMDIKKTLKKEQTDIKNAYSYMEELLTLELNKADFYRYNCIRMYFPINTGFTIDHSHCNPFVDKYIRFIIPKYSTK